MAIDYIFISQNLLDLKNLMKETLVSPMECIMVSIIKVISNVLAVVANSTVMIPLIPRED
jgi:hypothetical protein